MNRFKIFAVIFSLLVFSAGLSAEIKENELEKYSSWFMSKLLRDNPGRENDIRTCMGGIMRKGSAGTRIVDKFGLFLYDSSRNRLALERVKYFKYGNLSSFLIIMKDESDDQLYSLYVEYRYAGNSSSYSLEDIYFSMIFRERMESVRNFFEGD